MHTFCKPQDCTHIWLCPQNSNLAHHIPSYAMNFNSRCWCNCCLPSPTWRWRPYPVSTKWGRPPSAACLFFVGLSCCMLRGAAGGRALLNMLISCNCLHVSPMPSQSGAQCSRREKGEVSGGWPAGTGKTLCMCPTAPCAVIHALYYWIVRALRAPSWKHEPYQEVAQETLRDGRTSRCSHSYCFRCRFGHTWVMLQLTTQTF